MNKKTKISIAIVGILIISIIFTFNRFNPNSEVENEPFVEENRTDLVESYTEMPSERVDESRLISYIRTLVETELFDLHGEQIGVMGENQTFTVLEVDEDGLIELSELPFYVHYDQIEVVEELPVADKFDLDLSRYLAFEQMIAQGSTVRFYHLDRTFAFQLNAIEINLNIYMQVDDYFYISYLDRYFLVVQDKVTLVEHPDVLPETTRIPVLMYHFFCNSAKGVECRDSNWLERDHFEAHMQHLYEHNFTSLKMIDLERFLNGNVRLPEQSVVITIDDAHWSFFEHGYSILAEFDQIATTFAITNHDRDWEALMLSEQLEFHSHTHDMHRGHCDEGRGGLMQCIDFDEGVTDLLLSRALLNDTTVFCYPFGDFNDHTRALLEEAGFTMAFTTQNGLVTRGMDPLLLPRVRVSTDTHLPQFIHLISQ